MGFSFNTIQSDFTGEYITVRTAAKISGYNQQYLRRLLRENVFQSKRIGKLWLIDRDDFLEYLSKAKQAVDKRYGPH
ncbi:MAG: helix-turn-helix domain-containing protein [Anaerolineales bacterium]